MTKKKHPYSRATRLRYKEKNKLEPYEEKVQKVEREAKVWRKLKKEEIAEQETYNDCLEYVGKGPK